MRLTLTSLLLVLVAGTAGAQDHPSQHPELSLKTTFPRCAPEALIEAGFPDHKHAYWWPTWQVRQDAEGVPYGPGAFCRKKKVIPREGLIIEPGHNGYGHFSTHQNAGYQPCDFLPLLETLDWAVRDLSPMLGLEPTDTLQVISPDNIPQYREATGQDVWRLYKLTGNTAIIEPYGTLQARTLDGHMAFSLVTDWLLSEQLPVDLPPWLHYGLVEYFGDNGVHLVNYMQQFRPKGNPVFTPVLTDFILSSGVDGDPEKDRENYRRASYSAFLMAWELVENRGGVVTLRDFLVLVCEGVEPDRASQKIWDMDLQELASSLDPAVLGEPIADSTQSRSPAKPPQER